MQLQVESLSLTIKCCFFFGVSLAPDDQQPMEGSVPEGANQEQNAPNPSAVPQVLHYSLYCNNRIITAIFSLRLHLNILRKSQSDLENSQHVSVQKTWTPLMQFSVLDIPLKYILCITTADHIFFVL